MKARQDELKKRRAIEEEKRQQQKAALVVRKVIQRMRAATVNNIEELYAELEIVQGEQEEKMGPEAGKVREEGEKAFVQVQSRLEAEREKIAEAERKQLEEEDKLKQEEEWIAALAKAAFDEVEKAEAEVVNASEVAEPISAGAKGFTAEELMKASQAALEASELAENTIKEAKVIIVNKRREFGNGPEAETMKNSADFKGLSERCKVARETLVKITKAALASKDKASRMLAAEKKEQDLRDLFSKYSVSDNECLNREEVSSFVSDEYGFDIASETLDKIFGKLASGGGGVPLQRFKELRSMAAIEKSVVRAREKKAEEENIRAEVEEIGRELGEAHDGNLKAQAAAKKFLPGASAALSAEEMDNALTEAEGELSAPKKTLEDCRDRMKELEGRFDGADADIKKFVKQRLSEVRQRASSIQSALRSTGESLAERRASLDRVRIAELEDLRLKTVTAVRSIMQSEGKTGSEMFEAVGEGSAVKYEAFATLVKSVPARCPPDVMPEALRQDVLEEQQLKRLFQHVAGGGHSEIDRERFALMITRVAYRVGTETMLTEDRSIKSRVRRRLEAGEVLEELGLPEEDDGGVRRVRCMATRDDQEGWATLVGTHGTVFLRPWGAFYRCVNEAVITDGQTVTEGKTVRRLRKGEIVEALDLERKDTSIGVMRVKCRAVCDATLGWVTTVGNAGTAFLEPC